MIILWLSFFDKYLATHGDLQGDPFRLGLSGFSKFGSFLLQEVVDWLALHQEWLEEKQISFGRATFQSLCCAGQDWLLFRWQWNCCQGQGYCCPSDLLHRRLQTADLVQCRECKVFKWKMWFFAAAVSWLQVRETVRLGWLAGSSGTLVGAPITSPPAACLVTRAFYCYRPKISVTAVWPRWRPSLGRGFHNA